LIVGGITAVVIIVAAIFSSVNNANQDRSDRAQGIDTSDSADHTSIDSITAVQSLLSSHYQEHHVSAEIVDLTNSALTATGVDTTSTNRINAWKATFAIVEEPEMAGVDPWNLMDCVSRPFDGAGLTFAQKAAKCAAGLKP
jgi:hypothetical protein